MIEKSDTHKYYAGTGLEHLKYGDHVWKLRHNDVGYPYHVCQRCGLHSQRNGHPPCDGVKPE